MYRKDGSFIQQAGQLSTGVANSALGRSVEQRFLCIPLPSLVGNGLALRMHLHGTHTEFQFSNREQQREL